jgi:glycosyl transferase family 25
MSENNLPFPIWMINLERSKDRLAFQEKQFKEHGLSFERFNAVDGRNELSNYVKDIKLSHRWHNELPGKKGCALSHIEILKKIVSENIPQVIVMEDDVILCENFREEFNNYFDYADLSNDIIFLGNQKSEYELTSLIKNNIKKTNMPTYCTHGLIYTLNGAKNILKIIDNIGLYVIDIIYIEQCRIGKIKSISYIKKPSEHLVEKYKLHKIRSIGLC